MTHAHVSGARDRSAGVYASPTIEQRPTVTLIIVRGESAMPLDLSSDGARRLGQALLVGADAIEIFEHAYEEQERQFRERRSPRSTRTI